MPFSHWLENLLGMPPSHARRSSGLVSPSTEQIEQRLVLTPSTFGQYPSGWGNDGPVQQANGNFYFSWSDPDVGTELFKSDGTQAGTSIVKNFNGNQNSNPTDLTVVNNSLFFIVSNSSNSTYELYKTDGTDAGTILMYSSPVKPTLLTPVGNKLFFISQNGSSTNSELFASDGTAAGTGMAKDIQPGSASSGITAIRDLNGIAIFTANDGTHGAELWRSDGTDAGTFLLRDITPGAPSNAPSFAGIADNKFYFNIADAQWATDGTEAGTVPTTHPAGITKPNEYTPANGNTYFYLTNSYYGSDKLYYFDGANSTLLRSATSGEFMANLAFVNGYLIFASKDPANGLELWKSDGTVSGTTILRDIRTGSSPQWGAYGSFPSNFKVIGNTAYFSASDGNNGFELWKTDGTAAGTTLLKDLSPGSVSSYPARLSEFNGKLVVATYEDFGNGYYGAYSWWISDGTPNGTNLLIGNHAPLLNSAGNPTLSSISGDIAPENNNGTLVKDILASMVSTGGGITDIDLLPQQSALLGIAIYATNSDNGVWQFSLDDGATWSPVRGASLGGGYYSQLEYTPQLLAADNTTRLRYQPDPGTSGNIGVAFRAWDRTKFANGQNAVNSSYSASIGQNTSLSEGTEVACINVSPINHAPTLNPAGNPALNPIPRDYPSASNNGTLVSTILASMNTDGGGTFDSDPGYVRGLAVIDANQQFGTWQYSTTNGSSWNNFGSVSQSNALLLAWNGTTRIRFVPVNGYQGIVRFSFLAWDQTSGTNGGYANAAVLGGNTAFSNTYDEAKIVVGSPNKAASFGVFRNGDFYLDSNLNRNWNGTTGGDSSFGFGIASDIPIVGDWNGDARSDIGIFRNGNFYLDSNGSRTWDGTAGGDSYFGFGSAGDKPLTGDWNGDGKTDIGIWRNGNFYLDFNGNQQWDGTAGGDLLFGFGSVNDTPLTGDWSGDGKTDIGVYRNGTFYLDANGNRTWNDTIGGDAQFGFAAATDLPVTGDWNGDGKTDVGVFRNGTFYLDQNGNQQWDNLTGGDAIHGFSAATDIPLIGTWGPQNVLAPSASPPAPSAAAAVAASTSSSNTSSSAKPATNTSQAAIENLYKSISSEKTKKV